MDEKPRVIEQVGTVVAGATFLLSLMLYYHYSDDFWYSLPVALMTVGVVWPSYIVLRWIYLAIKE